MSYSNWRSSRSRGSYCSRRNISWRKPETVESPSPPVGDLFETIPVSTVSKRHASSFCAPVISDVHLIASYNWVGGYGGAKIIIPGKPPLWNPPAGGCKLAEDSGIYYRDRNAASYPTHPLEPAVVSVMRMHPEPSSVDLFACSNTVGNLLKYVQGQDKSFRMLVEVVGDTVHFIRRENTPTEQILDVRGYGHTFPEAYTTWESNVRRSISHQRILKYRFGGLDMMVRFEGDGYVRPEHAHRTNVPSSSSLLAELGELRVHSHIEVRLGAGQLQVDEAGEVVPQHGVLDVKTRSITRKDDDILGEQLPRLWVAQIPKFVLGFHEHGKFGDVEVQNITEDVQEWESLNQEALGRLQSLLHRIIEIAQSHIDDELEIVRESGGELEVRTRAPDAGTAFSETVREEWATWLRSDQGV